MDDFGPSKPIQLKPRQKASIKKELRTKFSKAMSRELDTLKGQEGKFMSDIPETTQEQVWNDVYKKVLSDSGILDSEHERLASQFTSVKKELMNQVNSGKKLTFAEPEEDPFELFGANSESEEEEPEGLRARTGSKSQEEDESEEEEENFYAKVIVEEKPSFFDKAKQAIGGIGGKFKSLFGGSKKLGPELDKFESSGSGKKLETKILDDSEENADLGPDEDDVFGKLEKQFAEPEVKQPLVPPGPVTLFSARPPQGSQPELFTVSSSSKKTALVSKPVVSQPMPTPKAALDQIAIYKQYFDERDDRGCEQVGQGLTITINDEDDNNNEKQYYIRASTDPMHPGVDFIAEPLENGEPDMDLILRICADAADAAIAKHNLGAAPKVNFEIPGDVPQNIRNAMQGIFLEKHKTTPGAFLVNSVVPVEEKPRGPRLGGGASDAEG